MFSAREYPQYIKYMGSKSKIIQFVLDGINEVHNAGAPILDVFAGSASLSGAIGDSCKIISNDIQSYSGVISSAYLSSYIDDTTPSVEVLNAEIDNLIEIRNKEYNFEFDYKKDLSLDGFVALEEKQRLLINRKFKNQWHLFTKNYSGTWWTAEQCVYIDAIREVADNYKDSSIYNTILSSLMYAMAYASQGTGHFAQYRDAKSESSKKDILTYRKRSLINYFNKKYTESLAWLGQSHSKYPHQHTTLDYFESIKNFEGGTVYADPPYCFVHYSRFYHALETIIKYDYPEIQIRGSSYVKGRYRENRHQSPFSIASLVESAFVNLFDGVNIKNSNLVLSYSNTGMISMERLLDIAKSHCPSREIKLLSIDHKHMTLGRANDRDRDVKEWLILIK